MGSAPRGLFRSSAGVVKTPCLALLLLASAGCAIRTEAPVNRTARIFKDFSDRVQRYVSLHKKLESSLTRLPDKAEPAQVNAHRDALAAAIREGRADARHEDIFFDEVAREIRRIISREMRGRQGAAALAAIKEGNPRVDRAKGESAAPVIKVNAPYPQSAPLSTVPPSILLNLPKLPAEVEYRFVGRHLILRDVAASLIVDYVWEATPRL